MCARVVTSAKKHTKRAPGRRGGVEGALTTGAPMSNRSRNTDRRRRQQRQQSVVGESVSLQSFTTRPALRSSRPVFFSRCTCSSLTQHHYTVTVFRLLSVFSFWRHPRLVVPSRFSSRTTPPPSGLSSVRTVIILLI